MRGFKLLIIFNIFLLMFNLTVKAQSFGEGGAYERPIDQQQLLQDLRFLLRASVVHLYGKNLSYKQKTKGFC